MKRLFELLVSNGIFNARRKQCINEMRAFGYEFRITQRSRSDRFHVQTAHGT